MLCTSETYKPEDTEVTKIREASYQLVNLRSEALLTDANWQACSTHSSTQAAKSCSTRATKASSHRVTEPLHEPVGALKRKGHFHCAPSVALNRLLVQSSSSWLLCNPCTIEWSKWPLRSSESPRYITYSRTGQNEQPHLTMSTCGFLAVHSVLGCILHHKSPSTKSYSKWNDRFTP